MLLAGMIDQLLKDFSLDTLPTPLTSATAQYVACFQIGNILTVSGQLPWKEGKAHFIGKVGDSVSLEEAQKAAFLCGQNIIAQVINHVGSLDKVESCARLGGFVNCVDSFTQQPAVIDAASALMNHLFDKKHARAAVGTNALPLGVAVEIEATFVLK